MPRLVYRFARGKLDTFDGKTLGAALFTAAYSPSATDTTIDAITGEATGDDYERPNFAGSWDAATSTLEVADDDQWPEFDSSGNVIQYAVVYLDDGSPDDGKLISCHVFDLYEGSTGDALELLAGIARATDGDDLDARVTALEAAEPASDLTFNAPLVRTGDEVDFTPTGTPDGSKFLRDDGTWATVPSGSGQDDSELILPDDGDTVALSVTKVTRVRLPDTPTASITFTSAATGVQHAELARGTEAFDTYDFTFPGDVFDPFGLFAIGSSAGAVRLVLVPSRYSDDTPYQMVWVLPLDGGVLTTSTIEAVVADAITAGGFATVTDISDAITALGLGTAATKNVAASGNAASGEVVKGNDTRLSDSRAPSGTAGGDLTGTYPNPTIGASKVTSSMIVDGTIVDADINASAAIAQSKVASLTTDLAAKAPLASPTFTGTPAAPTASAGTNTTQLASTAFVTAAVLANRLHPTAVKTSAYTAAAADYVRVDTTSGVVVITLPTAPADGTEIAIKRVAGATNAVTVNAGGSDTFNTTGGATSASLSLLLQAQLYNYSASDGVWIAATSNATTQLDSRYVDLTNAQTVAGVKTFSSSPIVPTPTTSTQAASKGYVDGIRVRKRKQTDQSKLSNTTLADITDMTFSIGASEEWIGRAILLVNAASTAADLDVALTVPSGATLILNAYSSRGSDALLQTYVAVTTSGTRLPVQIFGSVGGTTTMVYVDFSVLNSTTPGTVALQFSQSTSTASNTTIVAGSPFYADRTA